MEEDPLRGHPRYERIHIVGRGIREFVVRARDNERNEDVAIKFLQRGFGIDKRVEREIICHKQMLHPHVVQFKDVFLTANHVAIVMEYASGGDLETYVHEKKGIPEDKARWFFQQLIVALDYIHLMGVAMRDIKLSNILLDVNAWPVIKICNFGLSKHEEYDSDPHSFVGTRPFMAPEIVRNFEKEDHWYDGKKQTFGRVECCCI